MRKIVTILVVLLLASPAIAGVSITVTDNGDLTATISYSDDGDPNYVRAFALDITVDGGAVITAVDATMAGDCNATDQGYGIFPGSFARVIDAAAPDWGDPNYSPVGNVNDLPGDTQGGIGTSGVTVEMGSLYEDGNSPPPDDSLCTITVDKGCCVTLSVNAGRGGVVLEDASAITPTLTGGCIVDIGCATCKGDMSGDCWITTADMGMMIGVLTQAGPPYMIPVPPGNPCADISGDDWITTADMGMMIGMLTQAGPPYMIPCPQPCTPIP